MGTMDVGQIRGVNVGGAAMGLGTWREWNTAGAACNSEHDKKDQ